ncbi:MAG TPA: 2-hydroxyacid dehydrogenase [Azospirillaceae bacterium]|nr:2-hydroxyacid dehydrogenase [Azospirillaceae bacterium]
MKPDILSIAPIRPDQQRMLEERFTVHRLYEAADPGALLGTCGERIRGVSTTGFVGCGRDLMEQLPNLEIVACMAVGVDAVDVAYAKSRGIHVTNTPDVLNDCVADLTLGLLIASARRLVVADRFVRTGEWRKAPMPLATSLGAKRLGIVGLGRIGLAVARRAEPFGLTVAYHNRRQRTDVPYRYYDNLTELARNSDFLAIITPGGPETRRLIDRAVLDALGPQGTLINVARGSVVDEPALVAALQEGRLGAAALDVFEDEPQVPEALLAMDNVVLAPHVGSATVETRAAMAQLVVDNLIAHFDGRPLPTPV